MQPLQETGLLRGMTGRAAMLVFLAAFVFAALRERCSVVEYALYTSAMAAAAFVVIGLGPSGSSPILLVLLGALLAGRLAGWQLAAALVAINLVMLVLVRWQWDAGWRYVLILLAAFASFQLFAALVMRQAQRAEAMAADLREANASLHATRTLLEQGARDTERLRLSRELHDVAGHALTALKLNLGALARDPLQPDPKRLSMCAGLADELLQNLRGVVRQMRQQEVVDMDAAIRRLASPFPRPRLHLDIDGSIAIDSTAVAEVVLRTVQEGLTNAARHSSADNLWVVLQRDSAQLRLVVRDDGRGAQGLHPGSGLSGMKERIEAIGGHLEIEAANGAGLRLDAWLPAPT